MQPPIKPPWPPAPWPCWPAASTRSTRRRTPARGLLLSESSWGIPPVARAFPRRNRIVSGLSAGVVVIEAAARSGSLITAHRAAEQGRDVFAIPGPIFSPKSAGTNQLIRDGAGLVAQAQDILEALNLSAAAIQQEVQASF